MIILLDSIAVLLILADLLPNASLIVSNLVILCIAIVIKTALVYPLTVYIDYLKYMVKYGDAIKA